MPHTPTLIVTWRAYDIRHARVTNTPLVLAVHGVEYAFGAHDYPSSGVFEVDPRNTPGFTYRGTVLTGTTTLGPAETRNFVEEVSRDYNGDTYHLIVKNCNHFTNDLSTRLAGKKIPGYINRLAWIGWLVNCILPEGLRVEATMHTPEYLVFDGTRFQAI